MTERNPANGGPNCSMLLIQIFGSPLGRMQNCYQMSTLGPPGDAVVKFTHSASMSWGSLVRIPGADMAPLGRPCCGRRPTYKVEEDGHRHELRASLPQQKEEDWQQLAQG